jgi:hypothetical protein
MYSKASLASEIEGLKQVLVDLIASFASANGAGIKFGFALSERLLATRVLDINTSTGLILCCEEDKLFEAIISEPYPRGNYVARLVAQRIKRAIDQINLAGGAQFLVELEASGFERGCFLLLPLYGVGPKFVENYCILAGIDLARSSL